MQRFPSIWISALVIPVLAWAHLGSGSTQEHAKREPSAAAVDSGIPTRPAACYRVLPAHLGVECDVQVYAGAAVKWVSDDNPLFAKDSLVRPISFVFTATWKEQLVTRSHQLMWRKLDSTEGLGFCTNIFGKGFTKDPDAPKPLLLDYVLKPKSDWRSVQSSDDLAMTLTFEPYESKPFENPTPGRPSGKKE